jgi:hypothetical protein
VFSRISTVSRSVCFQRRPSATALQPHRTVNLSFETIKLPPVSDVLVLARKHPQGKIGVMESFRFIAPDEFEMIEVSNDEDEIVEAVLVNKKILRRLDATDLLKILKLHVFPFVSRGEAVKVDLHIILSWEGLSLRDEE